MSAISSKLAQRKFPTKDVTICLDGELSQQRDAILADIANAQRALGRSEDGKTGGDDRLAATSRGRAEKQLRTAQKALADLEQRMRDISVTLRFTGVDFKTYNGLMLKHPPRKGRQETFNPETFFVALGEKSVASIENDQPVEIEPAEWRQLVETLTDGDFDRVAGAMIEVNRTQGLRGVDFLSTGSGATTAS